LLVNDLDRPDHPLGDDHPGRADIGVLLADPHRGAAAGRVIDRARRVDSRFEEYISNWILQGLFMYLTV
jgi:hypothetical protein